MDELNIFKSLLNQVSESENVCLISNKPLENNYIELSCKHCFNYMPLYNEIIYQKVKKKMDNRKLKFDEIKCPYCRTITEKLLPYYKYYDVKQIKYVNSPINFCMKCYSCEYKNKNGSLCNNSACKTEYGIFCNKHLKYTKSEEEILSNLNNDIYKSYSKKTIKELRSELKKNKLKLSGNKDDLIKRLFINNDTLDKA